MESWTDDLPWIGQYILDDHGNPMPATGLLQWGRWLEENDCRVALTEFACLPHGPHPNGTDPPLGTPGRGPVRAGKRWATGRVSTVFLGLDHNFWRRPEDDPLGYKPILWETMVFGGSLDGEQRRYTSREEALKGHRALVKELSRVERATAACIGF